MEPNEEIAIRLNSISAAARSGLAWSQQLYERERYERIIELAGEMAEILAGGFEASSTSLAAELRAGWLAQVTPGASGYVTPKVSTGAVCFDPQGRLLLGKRGDSGLWFVPTGWLEVGLTPAQNIVKEIREETGVEARPLKLIAVRDTRLSRATSTGATDLNPAAIHNIALTFLCEALSSELKLHPLETLEAGFFEEEEALRIVPSRARPVIEQGFMAWRGMLTDVYFDPLETL